MAGLVPGIHVYNVVCDRKTWMPGTRFMLGPAGGRTRVPGMTSGNYERLGIMAYWLMKTEPDAWSWDQQVKKGAKGEAWSGVRNFTARRNLKAMKKGDRAFFYHTGEDREIVGVVEVIRESYPDPTDAKGIFVVVDVKAVKPVPKPVTLAAVKAEPRLKEMALVKFSRLSVQPVTAAEWALVSRMGGVKD
jgi:predicted RNA-binding protein with PUA-like domain